MTPPEHPQDEPALGHIHIRTTMVRKSAYVRAAKPRTLVEWLTEVLDKAAGYNPPASQAFRPMSENGNGQDSHQVVDLDGIETKDGFIILKWGNFPYEILLTRIEKPLHLLGWVVQLAEKKWMTKERLLIFVNYVCVEKGWPIVTN